MRSEDPPPPIGSATAATTVVSGVATDGEAATAVADRAAPPGRPLVPGRRPDPELGRGDRIGRYTVLEVLGRGGMGVVYAAYDPQLDRRVALKFLRAELADDAVRLVREGRAIARLAHPNVVSVHDIGEHEGRPFVAMELIAGQSFDAWLAARPRRWVDALPLLIQAGEGLVAAHRAGVIHRDFKPGNILVGDDGRARVGDFGLARIDLPGGEAEIVDVDAPTGSGPPLGSSGDATVPGTRMGTPAYMSPEQEAGEPVDERSDQFSFAVATYEAVIGVRPFRSNARWSLALAEPARGPGSDLVPAALVTVLRRALAADPADRFPSMSALLDQLRRFDSSDPRTVGAQALAEASDQTRRWRRWLWGGLTAALAAVAVTTTISTISARSERDRARRAEAEATEAGRLAEARLAGAWRSEAQAAYDRGDLPVSLARVADLLDRGLDEPLLRMIVGTTSWAWGAELVTHPQVLSVLASADGATLALEITGAMRVVDAAGNERARVPLSASARGVDLDDDGRALLVIDPDLRRIELDGSGRVTTIARAGADWHGPLFLGDEGYVVRVARGVLVLGRDGQARHHIELDQAPIYLRRTNRLVVQHDDGAELIELATAARRRWPRPVVAAGEGPDGGVILGEADGTITFVDRALQPGRRLAIGEVPARVRLSPDGTHLAIGGTSAVQIWEVATGRRAGTISTQDGDLILEFERDDLWIGHGDGLARRWRRDGALVATVAGPGGGVRALWNGPAGLVIHAGSDVRRYQPGLKRSHAFQDGCDVRQFTSASAEPIAVLCADGSGRWWWPSTGAQQAWRSELDAILMLPDRRGRRVMLAGMEAVEVHTVGGDPAGVRFPYDVTAVVGFGLVGDELVVSTNDGQLHHLDLSTGAQRKAPGLLGPAGPRLLSEVVARTDSEALVVLDRDVIGRLDTAVDRMVVERTLGQPVRGMVVSTDGSTAAVLGDQDQVIVLDAIALTPRLPRPLQVGSIRGMALSPDGGLLAVTTRDERLVLHDARAGTRLVALPLGQVTASTPSFVPGGMVLSTGGQLTYLELPLDTRPLPVLRRELACRLRPELGPSWPVLSAWQCAARVDPERR